MGRMKKKYESGAATSYISRKQALKKLQLSLADFRRLCIIKGIYPHEPRHRKKVEKGSTVIRTYYFRKDIQFLLHEPLINKFRDFKIFARKVTKAINKGENDQVDRLKSNKPKYKLDHIVKERYPSFIDAVRDLDDCVSLVFLFATLPRQKATMHQTVLKCRRLSVEFLHYLIAARGLRKVFVSIKGIYYQAEVMGQTVTWVMPHVRGFRKPTDVDFKVMTIFAEFYMAMLGFINYRLFSSLSINYPPKLDLPVSKHDALRDMTDEEKEEEALAAMTQSLVRDVGDVDHAEIDEFVSTGDDGLSVSEEVLKEQQAVKSLVKLFDGKKFFLGRETPRESLTFILRSFGAKVSWDPSIAAGASFLESDDTITHQIVDRNQPPKTKYMNRSYVQPQWIYDSVNARKLLDIKDYLVGVVLPPHLSPFVEEGEDDYVPPERVRLLDRVQDEDDAAAADDDNPFDDLEDGDEDDGGDVSADDDSEEEEEHSASQGNKVKSKQKAKRSAESSADQPPLKKLVVSAGKQDKKDELKEATKQKTEERKLAEMMIPKKNKRLYNKIMYSKKKKAQEVKALHEKRAQYEESIKKKKSKRPT